MDETANLIHTWLDVCGEKGPEKVRPRIQVYH